MANDRIFIKNKISGKQICIGKHIGSGWYCSDDIGDAINNFYSDHVDEFYEDTHGFEIVYDNDESGVG